jgi:hypothetical protein
MFMKMIEGTVCVELYFLNDFKRCFKKLSVSPYSNINSELSLMVNYLNYG